MAGALDIDAINRVRAGLGLPLLPSGNNPPPPPPPPTSSLNFKQTNGGSPDDEPGSTLESREGAAGANWDKWNADNAKKLRREAQKEQIRKEREQAQRKVQLKGKGLADDDGDDDDDAKAWLMGQKKRQKKIMKNREMMLQRELAAREAELQSYTEKDLKGLRVGHELNDFDDNDAGEQILTLADAAIDASDNEDTLENVSLKDREREKERQSLKIKKPVYDPNAIEESGEKTILGQYDEEINGKKKKRFTLDDMGAAGGGIATTDDLSRRQQFSLDFHKDDKVVSDYREAKEIKIKKPKKNKKEKSKRKRGADDEDAGDDAMQVEETSQQRSSTKRSHGETFEDDDLQLSLTAQRRSALKKQKKSNVADFARTLLDDDPETAMDTTQDSGTENAFVLDETTEFVANMNKEKAKQKQRAKSPTSPQLGTSPQPDTPMHDASSNNEPPSDDDEDPRSENPPTSKPTTTLTSTGLDAEDHINAGLGSTLKMLTQRGLYTRGDESANARDRERNKFLREKLLRERRADEAARAQRERDRNSVQYKQMSNREREAAAQQANAARDQRDSRMMAEAFNREYKPNVDIKYVDEFGRRMDHREAFKHLSHQFHGKGSGKGKTEKRLQKIAQEQAREAKSSLDSSGRGMEGAMAGASRDRGTAGVRLQ